MLKPVLQSINWGLFQKVKAQFGKLWRDKVDFIISLEEWPEKTTPGFLGVGNSLRASEKPFLVHPDVFSDPSKYRCFPKFHYVPEESLFFPKGVNKV